MSTIDVAATTNGPAAGAKSRAAGGGKDDGAFSLIYETVAGKEDAGQADTGKEDGSRSPARGPAARQPAIGKAASREAEPVAERHAARNTDEDTAQDEGAEAEDDLTRLLGIGTQPAQAAREASVPKSTNPLRRDVLPQLPNARDIDADAGQRPQAARIVVIGRETHFAPVGIGSPGDANGRTADRTDSATSEARTTQQLRPAHADGRDAGAAQARLLDPKATALPGAAIAGEAAAAQPTRAEAGARGGANGRVGDAGTAEAGPFDPEAITAPRTTATAGEAAAARRPYAASAEGRDARAEAGSAKAGTREEAVRGLPSSASTNTGAQAVSGDSVLPNAGALVRIADQIVAQARELTSAASAAAAHAAQTQQQGGGPVRILRLQLQPEELGLVTARLRIVGGVLELRLTADRQQSVEVLQQDREGLLDALQRAGYKAEIASIEFARPQAPHQAAQTPAGNGSGQSFAQGSPGHDGGSASGGSDSPPDRGNSGNGAGSGRPDRNVTGGNGDAPARHADEPQAIYL